MSLIFSNAKESGGDVMEAWGRFGIPATISLYFVDLCAMVLFLIGMGPFQCMQDHWVYHSEQKYQWLLISIVVSAGGIYLLASVVAFRRSRNAERVVTGQA